MKDVTFIYYLEWAREDFIFHHRKMWNWIADESLKLKRKVSQHEYFEAMNIDDELWPFNMCYCCQISLCRGGCNVCPIDWKSSVIELKCQDKNERFDRKGMHGKWADEPDYKKSAKLARTIANLPEKE